MKTLAISNQKGGCGKTATAHALGEILASEGYRVLMIDTDPQGTLTQACKVNDTAGRSLAEVLGDTDPGELGIKDVVREIMPNLWLVPSDIALAQTELGLVVRYGREMQLKLALDEVRGDFDLCVIDCPPTLGLLVVNALAAADAVLVPCIPQEADLRGLRLFLATLGKVRRGINPHLEIMGIVPTMVDLRTVHHRSGLQALRDAGLPLLDVTIGRSVRVAEAVAAGHSVAISAPDNPRSDEYRALAQEVIAWVEA